MGITEILAPAKDLECLKGVIDEGADSIYMGYAKFNARLFGENFTIEQFREGIMYAHMHHAKVYLTLNTLIKEREMNEAVQLAIQAYEDGVDAIIVQDLGLAARIRKQLPNVVLHASTQMTASNHYGMMVLEKYGFERVVIARELNAGEVATLTDYGKKYGIELEVFIHGGLCIAYSGQCYASSFYYHSTANRGLCKMPCWGNYTLYEDEKPIESGNLIRPRDLCGIEELGTLLDAGVSALKIQGRLRKYSYITEVVRVYREAMDTFFAGVDTEENEKVEKALEYSRRLNDVSPRGLTGGNLSSHMVRDIVMESENRSVHIWQGQKNQQIIENQNVNYGKPISVYLARVKQEYHYETLEAEIDRLYLPFEVFQDEAVENIVQFLCTKYAVYMCLPIMILERNCDEFYEQVCMIAKKGFIKGLVLSNLSDFILIDALKDWDIDFISNYSLHIMNHDTINWLKNVGISRGSMSLELTEEEMRDIHSEIPLEQTVYGHLELMNMKYCVLTKRNECTDCNRRCCETEKRYILTGEHDYLVHVQPYQPCTTLYGAECLHVKPEEWVGDSIRVNFLDESVEEMNHILKQRSSG